MSSSLSSSHIKQRFHSALEFLCSYQVIPSMPGTIDKMLIVSLKILGDFSNTYVRMRQFAVTEYIRQWGLVIATYWSGNKLLWWRHLVSKTQKLILVAIFAVLVITSAIHVLLGRGLVWKNCLAFADLHQCVRTCTKIVFVFLQFSRLVLCSTCLQW